MARFYADEDFDRQVVLDLRRRGHDLLTVQEAGQGNQGIEDAEVLAFAAAQGRTVLTFNRRDFINLHRTSANHSGIVVCTRDPDAEALAERIDRAVTAAPALAGRLLRINRPQ